MNELFAIPQLKDIRHLLPTRSGQSYKKQHLNKNAHHYSS